MSRNKYKGPIEKDYQIRAFETYYHMRERSLTKLSDMIKVPLATLNYWSRVFKWQERVQERDKKLKQFVEKKALIGLSKTIDLADDLLNKAIEAVGNNKIVIKDVNDIKRVVDIYNVAINASKEQKGLVAVDMSAEATETIQKLFNELAGANDVSNFGEFADAKDLESGDSDA